MKFIFILFFSTVLSAVSIAQCPHAGNGVGSIPYPSGGPYHGVSFRVWAPHASAVSVKDPTSGRSAALVSQGSSGYWCLDVPGLGVNQKYDYVITTPGFGTVTRRDPNARMVTSGHNGHSITYDPTAYRWRDQNFTPPALNKLVIYEMDTGQFNAGQSGWGTFQSSIEKLGEISGMGFNAVELLPVTQFDGIRGNPYGPTDQYAADNDQYGGPDNLKAFVDACHQRGLAVILDVVHNHWGPFDTGAFDFDGWHTTTYPGGIYFYDDLTASGDRYDSPWGPRPDYGYTVVKDYIIGQIAMWFDEYHADGLRWDSISNIYNAWSGGFGKNPNTGKPGVYLSGGINLLRTVNTTWPQSFKIAEDLSFSQKQSLDTIAVSSSGLGFDSQWNATLGYFVRKDFPASAIKLADVVSGMTSTFNNDYLQSVAYVESHNELTTANSRLYQLVDPMNPTSRTARKKATLAAGILFTSPEIPMIFQGDEFLDPSWLDNKTTLDWTNAQTWAGIVQLYTDLVSLRTDAGGISPGLSDPDLNIYQQDKTSDVLVYDRYRKSAAGVDDVIVVANLSGTVFSGGYKIGLPYGGTWHVLFNSDSTVYSSDFGNVGPTGPVTPIKSPYAGQPYSATILLGDYSVLVLSRE
ncbi:MAG TPA: alpha-amylase family glycosyl hydrolase [Candidatus Eisenbacteria bacterium]|nr:alpha-amylase family glycosyl hydrolase [Candidatus Eisenbacteria bacterium]